MCSVVDPDSLHSDPVFQVTPDPDLDPGFRRLKLKIKIQLKKYIFFDQKLHFTCP